MSALAISEKNLTWRYLDRDKGRYQSLEMSETLLRFQEEKCVVPLPRWAVRVEKLSGEEFFPLKEC